MVWFKRHKHLYRYVGRWIISNDYLIFKCEVCSKRQNIHNDTFWSGVTEDPNSQARIWLWNNA